jgi:hypothetical protein
MTMDEGLPAGVITMADLYRELTGMRADVARALTRIEVIDTRNGDADKLHADHEARIRALEQFRYKLLGAAVVIGGASGYVGYLLGHAH